MSIDKIDISQFKRDSSFYGKIPLLLTIKNFDLAAIRARYIKSTRFPNTEAATDVERIAEKLKD